MNRFSGFAAVTALAVIPVFAFADGSWTGPYLGAQAGVNSTQASYGISSETAFDIGVLGGYNYQLSDHLALGGDVFYEWNDKKSHDFPGPFSAKIGTEVYGVDVMAGFPVGENNVWMPFLKAGYGWADFTGNGGSNIPNENKGRYGAGIAWRLDQAVDVNFQYMYQKFGGDTNDWKNQNYTVGLTWHFQ